MDAIGLALVSAALFGAMPVAVRFGYARADVPAPAVVVLYMNLATFAVLVVAALFGVLLLSERLGWAGWLGCAVMLTGIVLAEPAAASVLRRLVPGRP